jgi:hypothetical protein
VLSDNVIAMRGREDNSRCRSCTAPSSKTTKADFESYIVFDQYLESQCGARESRSGFEGIVGSSSALHEVFDQIRTVAPATFATLDAARAEAAKIANRAVPGATLKFDLDFGWTLTDLEIRAATLEWESGQPTQSAIGRGSVCG